MVASGGDGEVLGDPAGWVLKERGIDKKNDMILLCGSHDAGF